MDGSGAVGVPHADLLIPFADAAVSFDAASVAPARDAVVAVLGHAAMIDAAAVIAGFNGITRIADATGIPLELAKAEETDPWRGALGIDRFSDLKS